MWVTAKILVLLQLEGSDPASLPFGSWSVCGPFVARWWSVVGVKIGRAAAAFRRRQPLVSISYLIVANWI
jgi:hypothetical protein